MPRDDTTMNEQNETRRRQRARASPNLSAAAMQCLRCEDAGSSSKRQRTVTL